MNPFFLFLLAIASPLLLASSLLLPIYAGIVAASFIIYFGSATKHPLSDKWMDVFYMLDVYANLFQQWVAHWGEMALLTYSLPLLALPLGGVLLSFWMTGKLASKLKDIFQLGASV